MAEFPFLEVTPKIPSLLIEGFLRGVGGIDILSIITGSNEAWIDFCFKGWSFQAHRDYEEWRFFSDPSCPIDVSHELSALLKGAEIHTKCWLTLIKGALFNGNNCRVR